MTPDKEERGPLRLPVDGELDLHAFRPQEVKDLIGDYLEECRRAGILRVRIIHGKGRGVLRRVVHAQLERHPEVLEYWQPSDASSWGATLVRLRGTPSRERDLLPPLKLPSSWARDLRALALLSALFLLTTLPFLSRYPFQWDGGQLVLGVHFFSMSAHQPHPPGYPLFVASGKLLAPWLGAHGALLTVGASLAWGALLLLYLLARLLWGRRNLAFWLGLAFLVNPLFWLYRETGLTYPAEALLGISTALGSLLAWRRGKTWDRVNGLQLGLLSGFRPSAALLFLPLLLFPGLRRGGCKGAVTPLIWWGLGVALWLLPMAWLEGRAGWEGALALFAAGVGLEGSSLAARGSSLLLLLPASLNTVCLPLLLLPRTRCEPAPLGPLLALWVLPPLFFYLLIHFGQPGYLLGLLPAFYLGAALAGKDWLERGGRRLLVWLLAMVGVPALLFCAVSPQPLLSNQSSLAPLARTCPPLFTLNRGLLKVHGQRVESYLQLLHRFSPAQVTVVAGRQPIPGRLASLPLPMEELFRTMGALAPAYRLLEIPAGRQECLEGYRFRTRLRQGPVFQLDPSCQAVLFLFKVPEELRRGRTADWREGTTGGHPYTLYRLQPGPDTLPYLQIRLEKPRG